MHINSEIIMLLLIDAAHYRHPIAPDPILYYYVTGSMPKDRDAYL